MIGLSHYKNIKTYINSKLCSDVANLVMGYIEDPVVKWQRNLKSKINLEINDMNLRNGHYIYFHGFRDDDGVKREIYYGFRGDEICSNKCRLVWSIKKQSNLETRFIRFEPHLYYSHYTKYINNYFNFLHI